MLVSPSIPTKLVPNFVQALRALIYQHLALTRGKSLTGNHGNQGFPGWQNRAKRDLGQSRNLFQ